MAVFNNWQLNVQQLFVNLLILWGVMVKDQGPIEQ